MTDHWNYRVVHINMENHEESHYAIMEVYYDDEGDAHPGGVVMASIMEDDIDGIKWMVDRFQEALQKPVIELDHNYKVIKNDTI